MAATEVRTLWHRNIEDAERAPKLTCCQSSSCATRTNFNDVGLASAANESHHNAVSATHFNHKFSISYLTHDARWWLNLQPHHHGLRKGLAYEKLNALENEVEILKVCDDSKTCKGDATYFGYENHDSADSMYYDIFQDGTMKKTCKEGMQEAYSKNSKAFLELVDMVAKHETMEVDSIGCLMSKQTKVFSLDSDYSWIEGDNSLPWWKTTDRDELACLVSQKSLNYIENCDLPPPRKKYLRGQSCDDNVKTACFDLKAKSSAFSNLTIQAKESLDSKMLHRKLEPPSNKGNLYVASDKSSSYTTTIHEDVTDQAFEGEHSKVQLMEALCHSQTRAREAEEEAKQAYAEKEHIIALFFIQASQLYAYKQWFKQLQLETKNNKDHTSSTLFQEALPWNAFEGRKVLKRKQKNDDVSTYGVAFAALGLSLVGAGLVLGWTIGRMLPPI